MSEAYSRRFPPVEMIDTQREVAAEKHWLHEAEQVLLDTVELVPGTHFTDQDILELEHVGEAVKSWFNFAYPKPFTYLGKVQKWYQDMGRLSVAQLRASANAIVSQAKAKTEAVAEVAVDTTPATPATGHLKLGYFTIVEPDGNHLTLRLTKHWNEGKSERGEMVVSYLAGPVNTRDYVKFGFAKPDGSFQLWSRFRGNERLANGMKVLASLDEQGQVEAGKAYALASGNCYVCGRLLTDPLSVELGIGPVCRA